MPALDGKGYLLRELGGDAGDFADPVGGNLAVYNQAAEEIDGILRRGFSGLQSLAAQALDPSS